MGNILPQPHAIMLHAKPRSPTVNHISNHPNMKISWCLGNQIVKTDSVHPFQGPLETEQDESGAPFPRVPCAVLLGALAAEPSIDWPQWTMEAPRAAVFTTRSCSWRQPRIQRKV